MTPEPTPAPYDAVIFDFNQTIVRTRDVSAWLQSARQALEGLAAPDPDSHRRQVDFLTDIWGHARTIDPAGERDLSSAAHRRITIETLTRLGGLDPALAVALYDTMSQQWEPFAEAPGVLRSLRARGIRLGLLSNIGLDIRPCLAAAGILDLLDAVVLSFEVGVTKPDPAIFAHTLAALEASATRTLMVGDSWQDDAGGAELGIRTLILPVTTGPDHGLDAVLRLVGPAADLTECRG